MKGKAKYLENIKEIADSIYWSNDTLSIRQFAAVQSEIHKTYVCYVELHIVCALKRIAEKTLFV